MDQLLPGDTDERRISIRTWLAEHPRPTPRQLAHAGYVAPHWPAPWGLAADPIHQLIIDDELARAGVQRPSNAIGIGWAGPTIAYAGSEEQKERYLSRCSPQKKYGANSLVSQAVAATWQVCPPVPSAMAMSGW